MTITSSNGAADAPETAPTANSRPKNNSTVDMDVDVDELIHLMEAEEAEKKASGSKVVDAEAVETAKIPSIAAPINAATTPSTYAVDGSPKESLNEKALAINNGAAPTDFFAATPNANAYYVGGPSTGIGGGISGAPMANNEDQPNWQDVKELIQKVGMLQEKVSELDMIKKRLAEVERRNDIDPYFCLVPWRSIVNNLNERSSRRAEADDLEPSGQEEVFKLPEDVYSIMATWNWRSKPFWTSVVVVFGFQILLMFLVLIDRLSGSEEGNPLNLPVNVEPEVRITQALAVVLAVISQDDLRVGIEGFVQGLPEKFRGDKCFKRVTNLQWQAAYFIRFLQGFMGMFASFILLMQAEDVIELLLNFLGIAFVSDLDDRFFQLGALGYLGRHTLACTEEIFKTEFCRDEAKHPAGARSCFRKNMHLFSVFTVLTSMIGCYLYYTLEQKGGAYSVHTFRVEFGDEIVSSLGLFGGCYLDTGGTSAGRIIYTLDSKAGSQTEGGTFAYCSEINRWTFFDSTVGNECNDYIVKSDVTGTFDIIEAGNLQWFTKDDEPLEFLKLAAVEQCDEKHKAVIAVDTCGELELDGVVENSRSQHYEKVDSVADFDPEDPILSHSLYIGKTNMEVVLFTGRRWVITDAQKLSNSASKELATEEDVKEYLLSNDFQVKKQDSNWVSFISEQVTSTNDQGNPLGLRWYYPRNEEGYVYNFPPADLSRPDDAIFACARCNNISNPCYYEGECLADGTCLCANGASGQLCRKKPLGDGECHLYFNEDTDGYDGGDCCASTCEGALCGTTSGFNPFGIENVTASPFATTNFKEYYEDSMGVVSGNDFLRKYDCQNPDMAVFDIEISNLKGSDEAPVGCTFGSVSVSCNGKFYLQTPVLLFPNNTDHCNHSYVEQVWVPRGANCLLELADPSDTEKHGYEYDVSLNYRNGDRSVQVWKNQERGGEVAWDVPSSQCLTDALSTTTADIFHESSEPGAAISRLSADSLSDYQCTTDPDLVKERYSLTLLGESLLFPTLAWDLHQCGGWGFPGLSIECDEDTDNVLSLAGGNNQEKPAGGTLPTEISFLSHLEFLSLHINNLNGTIPSELGSITSLSFLSLFANDLNGTIPTELGKLRNAVYLGLHHNDLHGPIHTELSSMTSLVRLNLKFNKLTGPIPSELGSLTALTDVKLAWNLLTGTIPPELGNIEALIDANFSSNDLMNSLSTEKTLYLNENSLNGTIPSELARLKLLNVLDLGWNNLTGPIPSQLGALTALTHLALDNNDLTGRIPSQLGLLTALTHLTLSSNHLTGLIPSEMSNLTALQEFSSALNDLTGSIPIALDNLPGWPGQFPLPSVNGSSNAITINVRTDTFPEEITFEWSKLNNESGLWQLLDMNTTADLTAVEPSKVKNETGLWQLLDDEDPAEELSIHNYTKDIESNTLYKLEILDSFGDGVPSGWFTITNSTPSESFVEGTLMWDVPGKVLEDSLVVFIWVDSHNHSKVLDCTPGEDGCDLGT